MVPDVTRLTRDLIRFETINPPGNEKQLALHIGKILNASGFSVTYPSLDQERLHVIADKGLSENLPPIVFSGHLDVVPLGNETWSVAPFEGVKKEGRLYGRGASDMKGGVAAMIVAAIRASEGDLPAGGLRIILTAGEEYGCHGARNLVSSGEDLGSARLLIVGEPTSNFPYIGHKGGLFLNARAIGRSAHSSVPHLGENAIYKAARAITKIEKMNLKGAGDSLLGKPTVNVGIINGGSNFNSVPDRAGFTIDIRSTGERPNIALLTDLRNHLGPEIEIEPFVDLAPVLSDPSDEAIRTIFRICGDALEDEITPKTITYLTDAAVLQTYYNGIPTVILGPGEPEMAHQVDEYCDIQKLEKSVEIYVHIIAGCY